MALFSGISAFPLTPTNSKGKLIPELLVRYLERIQNAGVNSIGLLGSTGSYAYLSNEERNQTLRIAVEQVKGKTPVIVGVGAMRTDQAEELAREALVADADGLLLAPISYQKLTDQEVFNHFTAVAAAGHLPLCIYNNPGTTNFIFSHELIARLSQISNIVAVKMPLPADGGFADEIEHLRSICAEGFTIGYSGDWGAKDALLAGADCWFSVVAGLLPEAAIKITKAAQADDSAELLKLNQAFQPLWNLFKEFGSFRVMYAIGALLDPEDLTPILPVQPLSGEASERVKAALSHLTAAVRTSDMVS
jgi:4-hydroxy-tetrahydrodipicolinate synthase